MDSLHYYTTRLFDIGLRINDDNINNNGNKLNEMSENELIDNNFKSMSQQINKKIKEYGNSDRFGSSKFNINVSTENNNKNEQKEKGICIFILMY